MTISRPDAIHLDDRAVRVLAHPLRSRLLGRLRITGPATATELARELETNTGATSYHLRALESVGLVHDTGEGVGRRRVWGATSRAHVWTDSAFGDDPDTRAALDWLRRHNVRQYAGRAEQWLNVASSWPSEWSELLGPSDAVLTLTVEQLRSFSDELQQLIARHRDLGAGDPAGRMVHLSIISTPVEREPPTSGVA